MAKIGRNDLCPCGSQKKFKNCHLGKSDEELYTGKRRANIVRQDYRKSRIKECMFFDTAQCSEKIIKAHSIQNNGVLSKLAIDGHVLMPKLDLNKGSKAILERMGKNEASIFTGFCKRHDNEIFKEIDDERFLATEKQLFLLAYRSFAKESFSKREAEAATRKMFGRYPGISQANGLIEKAILPQTLSVQDNKIDQNKFDRAFLSSDFSILETKVFKSEELIGFAVSSMFELDYDLEGSEIYDRFDYSSENKPPKLFINIFPDIDCSYIIISCFKDEIERYDTFFNQLQDQYNDNKEFFYKLITNMVAMYCENLVLSPKLVEKWGDKVTDDFLLYYHITALEQMTTSRITSMDSLFVDSTFNLFCPM